VYQPAYIRSFALIFILLSVFGANPHLSVRFSKSQSYQPPSLEQMLERAHQWTDATPPVVYNIHGYQPDPDQPNFIPGYREDCSGFVSMIWKLPYNPNTGGLALITKTIPYDQLQPGDILLNLDPIHQKLNPNDPTYKDFSHVVFFNGWTDANGNHVKQPSQYYDASEENGFYMKAREDTKMPFPYYPGIPGNPNYRSKDDYIARRLVPALVQQFAPNSSSSTSSSTVIPTSSIRPGGVWLSPSDNQMVTDTIHFSANAYPTHPGDPGILYVYFTVGFQGSWQNACVVTFMQAQGDTYSCDVKLSNLNISGGQFQVSFDVYDLKGNENFSPQGIHTLIYLPPTPTPLPTATPIPTATPVPTPTPVDPFNGFVGCWSNPGDTVFGPINLAIYSNRTGTINYPGNQDTNMQVNSFDGTTITWYILLSDVGGHSVLYTTLLDDVTLQYTIPVYEGGVQTNDTSNATRVSC